MVKKTRRSKHAGARVNLRQNDLADCVGCDAGLSVLLIDHDGVQSRISKRPGQPSHTVSDSWWRCRRWMPVLK